jgi:ferredoxin
LIVDTWLVGIVPVALYPFFGGKIWCRYWCPLAKLMELFAKAFTWARWSRFAIHADDKCIACGECTRYCQVGIDVMQFALKQQELNNANSSCIGCGICVTACPMGVLSFGPVGATSATKLVQITSKN